MIEEQVKKAYREGLFENLEGAGKPLEITTNPHLPKELTTCLKMLKNAGYTPPEITLKINITKLRAELEKTQKNMSDPQIKEMRKKICLLQTELAIKLEHAMKLD